MACAHPFTVSHYYKFSHEYKLYSVPCNYCLNCRVDRRNWLQNVADYEKTRLGVGAFIVLTYDDFNIDSLLTLAADNSVQATIRQDDVKKFLANLRERLNESVRKGNPYKLQTYLSSKKNLKADISYIGCSEYGSDSQLFERPHFHICLFGVHYSLIRDLCLDTWKKGNVYIGDIKDGGIRYVIKYMDKMPRGKQAKVLFDDYGLARPKIFNSKSFASQFILSQLDDIKQNNYTVLSMHNKRLPIPSYYKKLLCGETETQDTLSFELDMVSAQVPHRDIANFGTHYYSLKEINAQKKLNAQRREQKLERALRNDGIPYLPPHNAYMSNLDNPDYIKHFPTDFHNLIKQLNKVQEDYYDPIPF